MRSPALTSRARAALAARLRELVPPQRLHPGGAHALAAADALVLGPDDLAWALAHLRRGAPGELRPRADGAVPLHAAWSSSGLVAGVFAPRRDELPGLRLELRLPIPHGGGTPNLDAAWDSASGLVGVEGKLTEHLAPRRPRPWRPAYHRPAMRDALAAGWREAFGLLLDGRWSPRFLDAGQLVRHALSLAHDPGAELRYVFWEPRGEHPELREHRAELDRLLALVGEAPPRLRATTWALAGPLAERYDVEVR